MVSHYRLVSGLGTLYALPLEIRHRIYQMYFSHRLVVGEDGGSYFAQHDRQLLITSKAVYNEAAPQENACGITLVLNRFTDWPPPARIRGLTEEIDVKYLEQVFVVDTVTFSPGKFPNLKVVRDDGYKSMIDTRSTFPYATIDDAFKGRIDDSLISHVARMRLLYLYDRMIDWDEIPSSVRFLISFKLTFDRQDGNNREKTIAMEVEKNGQQWKVIKRTGVKGTFSITTDEYGKAITANQSLRMLLDCRPEAMGCSLTLVRRKP